MARPGRGSRRPCVPVHFSTPSQRAEAGALACTGYVFWSARRYPPSSTVITGQVRLTVSRSIGLDAAIAKLFVSESLVKAAIDTVQMHGGYGFMEEYEVERALRDAIGATIYSGTSEMQRNIIARWLGLGSSL